MITGTTYTAVQQHLQSGGGETSREPPLVGPTASVTREREKEMEEKGICWEQGYHYNTTECLPNHPPAVMLARMLA